MKQDSILMTLGLAKRAGFVVSGEFSVEKAVKAGKAKLVVVAEDASDNTKKLFNDKCSFYKIPIFYYSDKESLGKALGQNLRTSVAVLDEGFSNALLKKRGI